MIGILLSLFLGVDGYAHNDNIVWSPQPVTINLKHN